LLSKIKHRLAAKLPRERNQNELEFAVLLNYNSSRLSERCNSLSRKSPAFVRMSPMTLVQRPAPKVKPSTSFHVSFCLPWIYIFFEKKEKREKKIFPVLAP
jgi:hypothetical protein